MKQNQKGMSVILLLLALAGLLAVAGAGIYAYRHSHDNSSATSKSSSKIPKTSVDKASGKPVSLVGEINCLTPKDSDGPQITICAIGLKTEDGRNYGLSSQDPTLTGSIPTGQKVRATGTISQQDSQFDIVGTLNVESVERL